MKTLYFDCFSGISGDMVIGALLDAGGDALHLETELKKLEIEGEYQLKWKKVVKNGITATKFDVILMNDDHGYHHEHGHHHHHHRSYQDIVKKIESVDYHDDVKNSALNIFKKIGAAEGKIHGMPLEEFHFHEVGAVDSIIDIIGTGVLLHHRNINTVKASAIPVGSGSIHIEHGVYPVPARASLDVLNGVPLGKRELKAKL